jgi:hypothetical protein
VDLFFSKCYSATVSVTATSAPISFGFPSTSGFVHNDGANEVWVCVTGKTATAGSNNEIQLKPYESLTWGAEEPDGWEGLSGVGVICSSAETATVRVVALRH